MPSRHSRVLVTGGAGFVGHHLVSSLEARGDEVLVVDDLSAEVVDGLPSGTRLARLDISTGDLLHTFESWRPDVVYHLAAQVSVPRSMLEPRRDLEVNVLGTLRVIEAAKAAGANRVVFTSSGGAVYGETDEPATEASRLRPMSYYGAHKALAERYVEWSGLSFAIARPSNVYGAGQPARGEGAVIAAFVEATTQGIPLVVHGDGDQSRDFLHVSDLVAALLLLGGHSDSGIWNVASGHATTVRELVEALRRSSFSPLRTTTSVRRPGDIQSSRLANDRLRGLGWVPRVQLDDGLRQLLGSEAPSAS